MNKIALMCMAGGLLTLGSCNDFLDRQPLDKVTPVAYFNSEADLAAYVIKQYDIFPNTVSQWNMGPFSMADDDSDNQARADANTQKWEPGQWRVPSDEPQNDLNNQEWSFSRIRALNFFFKEVLPKKDKNTLTGNAGNINHYIGEAYFLRAYEYFKRLKKFGDFPIVTEVLVDNKEELVLASQRKPRNVVARFILEDLDKAISMLSTTPPGGKNRITRDVAILMKSRVALYEASFETYHKGTPRVPGEQGWPGASMSYNSGFSIDLNKEIAFFADQAMASAKDLADRIPLTSNSGRINPKTGETAGWNPYFEMFGAENMDGYKEVLMWHDFNSSLNVGNAIVTYIVAGTGTGFTRGYVESYLMKNGLPIYANASGYKGDKTLDMTKEGRDERLQLFMISEKARRNTFTPDDSTRSFFGAPNVVDATESRRVTGYSTRKGLNYVYDMDHLPSGVSETTGVILFRATEAYLNYIEASCIKNNGTSIDGTAKGYWKQIRERAGVDTDVDKTIAATVLSNENDWAVYSGGTQVSPLLYNIRRERRCEFISEGMRWDDLIRWRALDQVKNYIIEGCNFWDEMYKDSSYIDVTKHESMLIPAGTPGKTPNISSKEKSGKYLRPYQVVEKNNNLYNGYTWMKANYLQPICISHIRIAADDPKGDISTSPIYQNPYWPLEPNQSQLE
ncbi:MAG: RagB/SusD family nutrient uptake outer membrane protein [Tannerellaceae bacterium]